jgi:hypothetical protein
LSSKEKKKLKKISPMQTYDAYAKAWREETGSLTPSFREIIDVLLELHREKIDECVQSNATTQKYLISDAYRESKMVFDHFLNCMEIRDPDQLISMDEIRDADSKIVCFTLFILSIEPPFYSELNQACLSFD